ncbi:hypothetical protein K1719_022282 [Acacia pycnantha]|nr:hypothetical protein K1719_022282 [Acacia pycnantha]
MLSLPLILDIGKLNSFSFTWLFCVSFLKQDNCKFSLLFNEGCGRNSLLHWWVYSAWASPFELAFTEVAVGSLWPVDLLVDAFFAVDILLTFFVAYLDKSTYLLVDDHKKIAIRLTEGKSVHEKVIFSYGCGSNSAISAGRPNPKGQNVTLFVAHFAGCMYNWMAAHHKTPDNTWIGKLQDFEHRSVWLRYTYSIYWSMVTLTMAMEIFVRVYIIRASGGSQRDAINQTRKYASKSRLPKGLKEQMLAHIQLKFKTAEVQQEVLQDLPKAIRSSIAQHLFRDIVESAYAFKGVSDHFITQLVSEIKAEYYPPKVDIILQNEMPSYFYILVSGAMDVLTNKNGTEQLLLKLEWGGMAGEIGVMFNIPQPFTVRCRKLSQVIRISHYHFKQMVHLYSDDGKAIITNFNQQQGIYGEGLNCHEDEPYKQGNHNFAYLRPQDKSILESTVSRQRVEPLRPEPMDA